MAPNDAPPGLDDFVQQISAPAPQQAGSAQVPPQDPNVPAGLDDFISDEVKEEKYGGLGQQAISAAEGAASALSFGASTAAEVGLGLAKPEDIQGRQDQGPGHAIGEVGALVAQSLIAPGVGAAGLLERAGAGAAKRFAPGAAGTIVNKVGSAVVKGAVENALYQSGREVDKFALDPKFSAEAVQTAAADIGLSGLLGAGIGLGLGATGQGAKALWNATAGKQTEGLLNTVVKKMGGVEGQLPDDIKSALNLTGVEITPAMKAAYSEIPFVKQQGKILLDSTTSSGLKFAAEREAYRTGLQDVATQAIGKTPEQLTKLEDLSEKQVGEQIKSSLITKLKTVSEPIEQSYGKISDKFKSTIIPENIRAELGDSLAKVLDNGVSAESPEAKLLSRVISETSNPKLATLEQLRNYSSGIRKETSGITKADLWDMSNKIKGVLEEAQEKTLTQVVEKEAPELIAEHSATKSAYKDLKNLIRGLDDRLHSGKNAGVKTFIRNLQDMDGEAVIRRLSPKGKADVIQELTKNFPEVSEAVKGFERDKLIKKALSPEGLIDPKKLDKQIQAVSPEMRQFLFKPEELEKLDAVKTLMDHIPTKEGLSGTPKGLDGIMSHVPASAAAAVVGLTTGSPTMAGLAYAATKYLGRDLPDATRLGLLKFLGSSSEVSAPGFKAMVEKIHAIVKGETLANRVTSSVFKAGKEVLPEHLFPDERTRNKLDKQLDALREHPESLQNVGGDIGHYMPEHAMALGQTAAAAVNYLNAIKPKTVKQSPLDKELPPNSAAKATYNRALDIAQQPLITLKNVKDGSITSFDVHSLTTMYPALYAQISNKLMNGIVDATHKGQDIPYNTRMGLSIFLQQPLDSTMRPSSILAAQPQPQPAPSDQDQQGQKPPSESSMKGVSKLPGAYLTPSQARAQRSQRD